MRVTIELADDEVLVAIKRVEGYEDAAPERVAEDAVGIGRDVMGFEYRVVTDFEPKE